MRTGFHFARKRSSNGLACARGGCCSRVLTAGARGATGVPAVVAWRDARTAQEGRASLIGLLPVISLWRACRIPLPALVSADPYGTLSTPLIDRYMANDAVAGLMLEARKAG